MKKTFCYECHSNTKSPSSNRLSQIKSETPIHQVVSLDNSKAMNDWELLLAEALTLSPWSPDASIFVDRAISASEGQGGAA